MTVSKKHVKISLSRIEIIYRGGRNYKCISINFQHTQSTENSVPSEVADFRVLHANHAISTAGDALRAIGSGVHLDCARKKERVEKKESRRVKNVNRKDVKDKSPTEIDPSLFFSGLFARPPSLTPIPARTSRTGRSRVYARDTRDTTCPHFYRAICVA